MSETTFELTTPNRTYKFTDIINKSEFWVEKIVDAIQKDVEKRRLEREKFNFRSSKWVPD